MMIELKFYRFLLFLSTVSLLLAGAMLISFNCCRSRYSRLPISSATTVSSPARHSFTNWIKWVVVAGVFFATIHRIWKKKYMCDRNGIFSGTLNRSRQNFVIFTILIYWLFIVWKLLRKKIATNHHFQFGLFIFYLSFSFAPTQPIFAYFGFFCAFQLSSTVFTT